MRPNSLKRAHTHTYTHTHIHTYTHACWRDVSVPKLIPGTYDDLRLMTRLVCVILLLESKAVHHSVRLIEPDRLISVVLQSFLRNYHRLTTKDHIARRCVRVKRAMHLVLRV